MPRRIVALGFLLALAVFAVFDPAPLEELRLRGFDIAQRLVPRDYRDLPVRIVEIDDDSLKRLGQWPWPRQRLASLIRRIAEERPRVVGVSILFAEPDRYSPDQYAHLIEGAEPEIAQQLARLTSSDLMLARALGAVPTVLALAPGGRGAAGDPGRLRLASVRQIGADPLPFLQLYDSFLPTVPEIASSEATRGAITADEEAGGTIRSIPLVIASKGRLIPALVTEMMRRVDRKSALAIATGENGVVSVQAGPFVAPTDRAGRAYPYFTPSVPQRYISAAAVLADDFDPRMLRDQLILVGVTALGLVDQKETPLGAMQGVEVQAQLLESMLLGQVLRRPPGPIADLTLTLVAGLVAVFFLPYERIALATCGAAAIIAACGVCELLLLRFAGILFDGLYPAFVGFAVFGTMLGSTLRGVSAEKRRIRSAFGKYLSPALVDRLVSDPSQLKLGGDLREMTFLFCDVRGFTAISEALKSDPEHLTRLINRFLTPMTEVILARSGTIDKYMGDCIMAFWNAPVADDEHADHACDSALAMVGALRTLNQRLEKEALSEHRPFQALRVGIGLNTGRCVVGNLGSEQRFDYSVLGDAVNLASRLEGQSKTYGVPIVIGEETRARASTWAALELDLIAVKGKSEAIRIYALLGDRALAESAGFRSLARRHHEMLECYRRRRWSEARRLVAECRGLRDGLDELYGLYETRIDHFRENPPPQDWNGTYTAVSK